MLGDGGVVDAGREEEGDAELRARLDVDLVDADPVFGKDLQFRERFLEDLAGDHVVAADVAVNCSNCCQRVGLVERAAGADDLPAGVREELVVLAGRVLERGGREKDFRHENREGSSCTWGPSKGRRNFNHDRRDGDVGSASARRAVAPWLLAPGLELKGLNAELQTPNSGGGLKPAPYACRLA